MVVDFEVYTGNTKRFSVIVTGKFAAPVDLSGVRSITYAIFQGKINVVTKQIGNGVTAIGNTINIVLQPEDTSKLRVGSYSHEIQIVAGNGDKSVIHQGRIVAKKGLIK